MAEARNSREIEDPRQLIERCTPSPIGRSALQLAAEAGAISDPESLRRELHIQLVEVCDAYDSMDHRVSGGSGGPIQDDCMQIRELIRGITRESNGS